VAGQPSPPDLLDYADYNSTRQRLYDRVQEAVSTSFPVENEQYKLSIDNLRYTGPGDYSLTEQKKALMEGRSLGRKLTGVYTVTDKVTGQPVSKTGRKTLLTVPYLTPRGTFIRNGVENVVMKQFRLLPNVYTRRTDDGSVESQFNVAKGTGSQFRLFMDPTTAVFYYRQKGRKIPLYPVLRASGMKEEEIGQVWGKDILAANKKFERSPHAVNFLRQYRPANMEKQASSPVYRVRVQSSGQGAFQAGREAVMQNPALWEEVAPKLSWLKSVGAQHPGTFSTFTKEGLDQYKKSGLYDWHRAKLGDLTVEQVDPGLSEEAYRDAHQVLYMPKQAAQITTDTEYEDIRPNLLAAYDKMRLNPDAVERTLGVRTDRVTPNLILRASGKILDVNRGQADTDDRDSLEFQTIHDVTDFLPDKIRNDQNRILGNYLWKLTNKQGDSSKIPSGLLDAHTKHLFNESGLAQSIEGINPLEMYDQNKRVIRLGEGGISSADVVPKDSRNVQPSYMGYVDPVRAPECYTSDMQVKTVKGWKYWPDVTENDYILCLDEGEAVFQQPDRIVRYEYDGFIYTGRTDEISYRVSPKHRMYASPGRGIDYSIIPIEELFSKEFFVPGDNKLFVVPPNKQVSVPYEGRIHCATVKGGIMFVRGGLDEEGFWCGNSLKIGVDMRLARNARKGPDNTLYTQFNNPTTGKQEWVSSRVAARSIIGFPDYNKNRDRYVPALVKSKGIYFVPREKVQYVVGSGDDMFSDIAQTVPLKSGVKGMRLLMASKFGTAALPLVNREAPLVQTADGKGNSVFKMLGTASGAIRSPASGVVKSVYKDHVVVQDDRTGETHRMDMYDAFPYPRKTYIRSIPKVKAGQRVKQGDLLATSNFTDDKGLAAPGRNLRVGYLNYRGFNFEDAVVISESAAKKMTSEHMYPHKIESGKDKKQGKQTFVSVFPSKFNRKQLDKVDDNGLIKKGQTVNFGDPLVLQVKEREPEPGTMNRRIRSNAAVTWKHQFPGVVTDVAKTKKGFKVFVRANSPAQMADKLANMHGGKGVISKIVPDDEMPRDSKGRPLELLLSPLGVISRTNSAQLVEAALGKVASKTGKSYTLPGFIDEDMVEFAQRELKKHNLSDTEDLYDPRTRKKIPKVFVGNAYAYKLQHTAESKGKGRSTASLCNKL
jgi:DNA-directed RNA polymerase beta subunit